MHCALACNTINGERGGYPGCPGGNVQRAQVFTRYEILIKWATHVRAVRPVEETLTIRSQRLLVDLRSSLTTKKTFRSKPTTLFFLLWDALRPFIGLLYPNHIGAMSERRSMNQNSINCTGEASHPRVVLVTTKRLKIFPFTITKENP